MDDLPDNDEPSTVGELARHDEDLDLLGRLEGRYLTVPTIDPGELAAAPPMIRAFVVTRKFKGEVLNGGLHQFFINCEDERLWAQVVEGYRSFGLDDVAGTVEQDILPVAREERADRARPAEFCI